MKRGGIVQASINEYLSPPRDSRSANHDQRSVLVRLTGTGRAKAVPGRLPVPLMENGAIGTGEKCVGDIAEPLFDRRVWSRRRARALDPLPLEVVWDWLANKIPCAGVADLELRTTDDGIRIDTDTTTRST